MAAKSITYANNLLRFIFNNDTFSGLSTNLYVSLHTANPDVNGSQNTFEATYPGYARVGVLRNSGSWVVTLNSVSPEAVVTFPPALGGSQVITHFGVGTNANGAGTLLYFGPVNPPLSVFIGTTAQLKTTTIITEN